MKLQEVNVEKIEPQNNQELADNFYRNCDFCDKIVRVNPCNFDSCQKLSGNNFFCPSCLRHNHHHRSSRNILPISYRAIIGYYYYSFYSSKPSKMYFSQIEIFIDKHQNFGLQNPVFTYDPFLFMWYINFNLVGVDSRKAPYAEVKETIMGMLDAFELKKHMGDHARTGMLNRFQKAVDLFYEKRKRPKDRKMLIPTLVNLVPQDKNEFFETTRDFTKNLFVLK